MIRETEKYNYITAEELLEIEQLCCFLKTETTVIFPEDIEISDKNCANLGRICYEPEIREFVFVPAIFAQED